jgi:hypothetical protein
MLKVGPIVFNKRFDVAPKKLAHHKDFKISSRGRVAKLATATALQMEL